MTENKRIIKFRAWDTKYKVMIEGFAIYDNADHLGMSLSDAEQFYTPEQIEADSDHFCGGDGDWIFIMGEFELLEFTGLTDKNGKEIYEGDIVRYAFDWDYADKEYKVRGFKKGKKARNYIGQIEWEGEDFAHFVINPKRMHLMTGSCLVEVIGNRHENPELIKS